MTIKYKELFEQFTKKKDFVMKEKSEKIEKTMQFTVDEFDKKFKRMFQAATPEERIYMGYDFPSDGDEKDIEITRQANEWLADGNPVD